MCLPLGERAFLIVSHEATVPSNIGCKNGREASRYAFAGQGISRICFELRPDALANPKPHAWSFDGAGQSSNPADLSGSVCLPGNHPRRTLWPQIDNEKLTSTKDLTTVTGW
jgi:hypothetical protein